MIFLPLVAAQIMRGIDPLETKKYLNFKCFDSSNSYAILNDDFCDCIDGSDEPGTSACRNSLFYCQNQGFRSLKIPSANVNDGVCDCCDGSDEWISQTCENTCHELATEELNRKKELEEIRSKGAIKKLELIEKAMEIKSEKLSKLSMIRSDIKEYLSQKQIETAKQNELEKRIVSLDTENSYIKFLTDRIASLWKKSADEDFLEKQRDEQRQQDLTLARQDLNDQKSKVSDLQYKFDQANQDIQDLEKELSQDNGPQDCFLALREPCIEKQVVTYTYKVCLFKSVDQDYTNLGKFESWDYKTGQMLFTKGQSCWQGPDRSTKVQLQCHPETEILSVSEPSKCEYLIHIGTPAMC